MFIKYVSPDSRFPLVIEKPTPKHKCYYVYEEGELDPLSHGFATPELALAWAKEMYPEFTIKMPRSNHA